MPKKVTKPNSSKKRVTRKKTIKKKDNNLKKNVVIFSTVVLMVAMVYIGYLLGQPNIKTTQSNIAKSTPKVDIFDTLAKMETKNPYQERLEENKKVKEELTRVKERRALYKKSEAKRLKEKEQRLKEREILLSKKEKKLKKEHELERKKIEKRKQNLRIAERELKEIIKAQILDDDRREQKLKKEKSHYVTTNGKKPKLAIIIDDISSRRQLDDLLKIGIKVTPSIFPPSKLSMSSHTLANGLKNFLIHLPMESSSRQYNKQYKTLMIDDEKATIDARVEELRRLFPSAIYINNHTGSKFTNDFSAMKYLYKKLRLEGFKFVDSRTIGTSKVEKVLGLFNDKYIARDIFIDNILEIPYIHKHLSKAVDIAKRRGYAVAIGHPHKVTIDALKRAKHILKDVELVYIKNLY